MPCALARQNLAAVQLEAREGEFYDQWCKSMAEVGRRLAARS